VIGNLNRPHLLEAWGQRFQVQLEDHVTMFRYRDQPGMLGRVGTLFGENNVNIVSSIVGRQPDGVDGGREPLAAIVITTDVAVPDALVEEIATGDGFVAGVSVTL
jgi:D-3-phosphoglycerate dehydrogenase / 2-oxoglutarate reductase